MAVSRSKTFSTAKKITQHASTSLIVAGMTYAIRDVIKKEDNNPFVNWALFGPCMVIMDMSYKLLWVCSFKREPLAHLIDLAGGTTTEFLKKLARRYLVKSISTVPVLSLALLEHYNKIVIHEPFFRNMGFYIAPSLFLSILGEALYDRRFIPASIAAGVYEEGLSETESVDDQTLDVVVAPGAGDTEGINWGQQVGQCVNAICIAVAVSDVFFYNIASDLCDIDFFEESPYLYLIANTICIFIWNNVISWSYTPDVNRRPDHSETDQPGMDGGEGDEDNEGDNHHPNEDEQNIAEIMRRLSRVRQYAERDDSESSEDSYSQLRRINSGALGPIEEEAEEKPSCLKRFMRFFCPDMPVHQPEAVDAPVIHRLN